jgi:TPR repeat protein
MSRLAEMYNSGEHVDQDYKKALDWHKRASKGGEPCFLRSVANTYRLMGNMANYKIWLERAYAGGDGEAALQLAELYMVSDKEFETIKKYLEAAINSESICEEDVDEAKSLLEKL